MSFFYLLKQNNLDFNRAKEIFYSLTDIQIVWLNMASEKAAAEAEQANENEQKKSNKFGESKSFNLRNE